MIDWGADIIFEGILTSLNPGNSWKRWWQKTDYLFHGKLSNQRIETMQDEENAKWTERGVSRGCKTIKKKDGKTRDWNRQSASDLGQRTKWDLISPEGYPLFLYQTHIPEDFIEGGSHRDKLDEATKERIDTAYKEMNEHVGWSGRCFT